MVNEKRLISADDFKKAFYVDDDCDEIRFGVDGKVFVDFKAVQRAIDDAPTVDAVEVMRCGQCVFSDLSMSVPCAYVCRNPKSPCRNRVTCADFGCLYGERRNDG